MLFKDKTLHGDMPADAAVNVRASLESVVTRRLGVTGSLDASDLRVFVHGSQVMISGSLSCREQIDRAIEAVMATPGVTKVNHTIVVRSF